MEDGYIEGIIVTLIVIGIFVVVVMITNKHIINKILQSAPQNLIEEIKQAKFYQTEENPNFIYGESYIYKIVPQNNGAQINMIYYRKDSQKDKYIFCRDSIFMNSNQLAQNDYIKVGIVVSTMHNTMGNPYKISKIVSQVK